MATEKSVGKFRKDGAVRKRNIAGPHTTMTPFLVKSFLDRVANGESVKSICRDASMPCSATIHNWLRDVPEFREGYARAKEMVGEALAEQIIELADELPGSYFDAEGNKRVDAAHVAWTKLRIESRRWLASKLKPKVYGDKTQVTGEDGGPVQIKAELHASALMDAIRNIEMKRRAE